MTGTTAGTPPPLLALDLPPPPGGSLVPLPGPRALRSAPGLRTPGVLWIEAPPGAGKTRAIEAALGEGGPWRGVLRIPCAPRLRLEEALYRASAFLQQLGIDELARVLEQRTPLDGKVGVFLETVRQHPVLIWWDDVECLEAGDERRSTAPGFLARCARLRAARGGLIFSADRPPPDGVEVPRHVLPPPDAAAIATLWEALGDENAPPAGEGPSPSPSPETAGERLRRLPLALVLLRGLAALDGAPGGAWPEAVRTVEAGIPELAGALLARLDPAARGLLETVAAFRAPVRRQALREVTAAAGDEVALEPGTLDPRLAALASARLIELDARKESWCCALHPAVQAAVEREAERAGAARWARRLGEAASYHLRVGLRSGDPWELCRARDLLRAAGCEEEACRLDKTFLERLLQWGYSELASRILAETVAATRGTPRAVALGNQAMIHKNRGDHDRALELYSLARDELEAQDDRTNVARVLHQIGNLLYLREDHEGALENYRESHRISRELGEGTVATATRVQIGNILWALGRIDEAVAEYGACVRDLEDASNEALAAAVELQLGQAHLEAKRHVEADTAFRRAAGRAAVCRDERTRLKALRGQAVAASERLDDDEARARYLEAEGVATALGDVVERVDCRAARGELEGRRGRLTEALAAYLDAREDVRRIESEGTVPAERLEPLRRAVDERLRAASDALDPATRERTVSAWERDRRTPGENREPRGAG